jgi:4-amino-4-deoxy-L-arabinose transferase-like glycosyltransferase
VETRHSQFATRNSPLAIPRERLALTAILLLAALLRLGWPGLTEFKADEARLFTLALDLAELKVFPWCGIGSSVGVPNSPVSVYLTALPLVLPFMRNPIGGVLWVGALNVLAVGLCFHLGRRYWGSTAALAAALLFAAAPWAVIYSRKIWAQNYLPLFALAYIYAGMLAFVEGRRRWLAVHLVLLAVTAQIHLSALALVPLTLILLVVYRQKIDLKWLGIGAVLSLAALLPYAGCLLASSGGSAGTALERLAGQSPQVSLDSLRLAGMVMSGKDIHSLAGPQAFEAFLATVADLDLLWLVEEAMILYGLATCLALARRHWSEPARQAGLVIALWIFAPVLFFLAHTTPPFPHYFIVMLPGPYLAVGAGVPQLVQWLRARTAWRWAFAALPVALAIGQAALFLTLLRFLATHNTPEGFGTPVGMQMAAVRDLREAMQRAGAGEALFVSDGDNPATQQTPAVFSVLLRGLPYRLVNGQTTAVLPAHTSIVIIAPGDLRARERYLQPAGDQLQVEVFGLRPGEGEYLRRVLVPAQAPVRPPQSVDGAVLANGVEIIGYGSRGSAAPGSEVQWEVWWQPGGPAASPEYHFFNHLVDGAGNRWGQQDGASYPIAMWREGDRIVSYFTLPITAEAPERPFWVRVGMYSYPDLAGVPVLDVAGNPAGDGVRLGPLGE